MASRKDLPKYVVLEKFGNFEIRQYEPRVIAEVAVEASFEQAIEEGFTTLAAYIFGYNQNTTKIAMTAPVEQRKSPTENTWLIIFSMPAKYTIRELPSPKDPRIALKQVESQKMGALIFSGLCTEKKIEKKTKLLLDLIKQHRYTPIDSCILARYDPPWKLPFFRHNELLFAVK